MPTTAPARSRGYGVEGCASGPGRKPDDTPQSARVFACGAPVVLAGEYSRAFSGTDLDSTPGVATRALALQPAVEPVEGFFLHLAVKLVRPVVEARPVALGRLGLVVDAREYGVGPLHLGHREQGVLTVV